MDRFNNDFLIDYRKDSEMKYNFWDSFFEVAKSAALFFVGIAIIMSALYTNKLIGIIKLLHYM